LTTEVTDSTLGTSRTYLPFEDKQRRAKSRILTPPPASARKASRRLLVPPAAPRPPKELRCVPLAPTARLDSGARRRQRQRRRPEVQRRARAPDLESSGVCNFMRGPAVIAKSAKEIWSMRTDLTPATESQVRRWTQAGRNDRPISRRLVRREFDQITPGMLRRGAKFKVDGSAKVRHSLTCAATRLTFQV